MSLINWVFLAALVVILIWLIVLSSDNESQDWEIRRIRLNFTRDITHCEDRLKELEADKKDPIQQAYERIKQHRESKAGLPFVVFRSQVNFDVVHIISQSTHLCILCDETLAWVARNGTFMGYLYPKEK